MVSDEHEKKNRLQTRLNKLMNLGKIIMNFNA